MTTKPPQKEATFNHALIVEDEPALAEALRISVEKMGIVQVEIVSTLERARETIQKKSALIDLILLDRRLPDGDGLELCRWLRAENVISSILVLTASGDTMSRVEGLDAGADDYLPKPFSWEELTARVRALFRRHTRQLAALNDSAAETLWQRDNDRLSIFGPNGWKTLTPLEFRLATRLMDHPNKLVKREDLLKDVWGFKWLPQTRTVDYFLGRLRKNFEKTPSKPKHFLTVRSAGYRFEP
jgi:DNA-binding response OmpR family regulator